MGDLKQKMAAKIAAAKVAQKPRPPRKAGTPAAASPPSHEDDIPAIAYTPGELPRVVDDGEEAILKMSGQPRVYQRGGILVRIVRRGPTSARRIKRADGGIAVIPVDVPHMVELLTKAATWTRINRRKAKADDAPTHSIINCPHEVATILLSRGQWRLPPLTGVLEAPTLRPDGSVLEVAGYDAATGLFLDFGSNEV